MFDILSLDLSTDYNTTTASQQTMRTLYGESKILLRVEESGCIWCSIDGGEEKIGFVEGKVSKTNRGQKAISIKLSNAPLRAVEALCQRIVYKSSRPNFKDRGTEREVQILLMPIGSENNKHTPNIIQTINLVGPIIDGTACFPRRYSGSYLSLIPYTETVRDCFNIGILTAHIDDCNRRMEVTPDDVLELNINPLEFSLDHLNGSVVPCSKSRPVAFVSGNKSHQLSLRFDSPTSTEATSLIRSLSYRCLDLHYQYISLSVVIEMIDEFGNVSGGVVKIDS